MVPATTTVRVMAIEAAAEAAVGALAVTAVEVVTAAASATSSRGCHRRGVVGGQRIEEGGTAMAGGLETAEAAPPPQEQPDEEQPTET